MSNDGYLAVCGIYCQENEWLREWLEYYLANGVDRFFLYCDDPDPLESLYVLKPYMDRGLIDWTHIHTTVGLGIFPKRSIQAAVYDDCIRRTSGRFRWLAIADLDEFYLPLEEKTFRQCLQRFEEYKQVLVSWRTFGTGGFEGQPPGQINHLFYRAYLDERSLVEHKPVVDPSAVAPNTQVEPTTLTRIGGIHSFTLKSQYRGKSVMADRTPVDAGGAEPVPTRYVGQTLVMNHYRFRGREWFIRTKTTRGKFNSPDSSMDRKWLLGLLDRADVNIVHDDLISRKFGHVVRDIDNSDILRKTMPVKRFVYDHSSPSRRLELIKEIPVSQRGSFPLPSVVSRPQRRITYYGLVRFMQGGLLDCFKSYVGLSNAFHGFADVCCSISERSIIAGILKNVANVPLPDNLDLIADWDSGKGVSSEIWSDHVAMVIRKLFDRKDELHVACPFPGIFQKSILAPNQPPYWNFQSETLRMLAKRFFEVGDEYAAEIDRFIARMTQGKEFRVVHCRLGDHWMRRYLPEQELEKEFHEDRLCAEFREKVASMLGPDTVLISDCMLLKEFVKKSGVRYLGISDVEPSHSTDGTGDGLGILKDIHLVMRAKQVDSATYYPGGFAYFLAQACGIPANIHWVGKQRLQRKERGFYNDEEHRDQ